MAPVVDDAVPSVGAPAARALAEAGFRELADLDGASRADLLALHGVGPKAVRVIEGALAARGLGLRP